jgi:catechol-2,3-dioxygenase
MTTTAAIKPRLAHVVLQTADLESMRDWYCTLLDGHAVYEGHGFCFITFDEEHHRIALMQPPFPTEPKSPTATGMHHMAFTFDTLEQLLDRYAELKEKGIDVKAPVQHGVTTSLYYRDPEGNFVEMQIDNFDESDDATKYMEGQEYDTDLLGPTFDPAVMRAALKSGTPVAELTSRAWAIRNCTQLADPFAAFV